ncbi:MAG TPA: ABC transporter permease [Candidatus Krumholzibacteria bacterium]|nr:ABC transporter permease [Candidatus Krumholzibacteria bacterium]
MKALRRFYHLARADFLERVRRHGFLVALLFSVYAGYAFLPPNNSRYVTLVMSHHRGIYNSAWIGTAVAMLSGAFVSLIGFFVVKNAVERDRRTGVGQILATTPISRLQYTIGKTLSNFAVLAAMTTVVALACVGMQFLRGEDTTFNALQMFVPFVLLTLPLLLVVSAVAVFFETMPVLRGGIGNVAFIFMWGGLLSGSAISRHLQAHNDPLGSGIALPGMLRACQAAFSDFDPANASVSMGINIQDKAVPLTTFAWNGIDWTAQYLWWRLSWVLAALGVAAVAAIPFDRFDTARSRGLRVGRRRRRRSLSGEQSAAAPQAGMDAGIVREDAEERGVRGRRRTDNVALTPLAAGTHSARFGAMVWAEWKLIVRGLRWWYAGPLGISIAALTAPLAGVRAIVLPLAWFWPVLQWSKLGTREATYNTEPVFFSAPHPLSRQLMATWVAGVMLSVVAAGTVALRYVIAGEWHALIAWCVGAAFAPSLAVALGTWTRSGKAFEAIYTGLCYAIIQSAAPLDFMGAVDAASFRRPVNFALLTALLLLLALWGRQRRLRN